MEWTEDNITFSVDDVLHYIYEPEVKTPETWPFDEKQYILLNVAILPNIHPSFTQSSMEIDYVRVYQEQVLNVENENINPVKSYPNPVSNRLHLDIPSVYLGTKIELYTMLGQNVFSKEIKTEKFDIDISGFQKGTYLLSLKNNSISLSELIVKL